MNKFIKVCFSFVFLLLGSMAFADDWYLCLGSYKDLDNAKTQAAALNNNDISVLIYEHKTSSSPDILYRILMDEPYSTEAKAVARRNQVQSFQVMKKLNIKNIWCFQPWPKGIQKAREAKRTGIYSVPATTTPKEITMNIQTLEEKKAAEQAAAVEAEEAETTTVEAEEAEATAVEAEEAEEATVEAEEAETTTVGIEEAEVTTVEAEGVEEAAVEEEVFEDEKISEDEEGAAEQVEESPAATIKILKPVNDEYLDMLIESLGETDSQVRIITVDEIAEDDEYAKALRLLINTLAEEAENEEETEEVPAEVFEEEAPAYSTPEFTVYDDNDPDRPSMIPYDESVDQLIINYTPYLYKD